MTEKGVFEIIFYLLGAFVSYGMTNYTIAKAQKNPTLFPLFSEIFYLILMTAFSWVGVFLKIMLSLYAGEKIGWKLYFPKNKER